MDLLEESNGFGLTLGAAFYGYTIGAALFGITITQAYHYFMTTKYGHIWQHYIVIVILILDTLHFSFAIHMMYTYLLQVLGDEGVSSQVVLSLKSMGSVQVFFTIFVQMLYLHKIWSFSQNPLLTRRFGRVLRAVVSALTLMAFGVGILFLIELVPSLFETRALSVASRLDAISGRVRRKKGRFETDVQKVKVIRNFELRFEYVIYVGFGATAFIDMGIAAAMCLMLHKSSAGTKRSNQIIVTLIQYIVGTGLLTSLGALLIMVLYIAWPASLLYLGVEYSMTRLYAISVLALYNSQSRLRDRLNETRQLDAGSMLYFAEPEKLISHGGSSSPQDDRSHSRRYHNRSDTQETALDSPDSASRRQLTRMFEHLDAEDTLVENARVTNGVRLAMTPSQNGRGGTARHYTA